MKNVTKAAPTRTQRQLFAVGLIHGKLHIVITRFPILTVTRTAPNASPTLVVGTPVTHPS